MHDLIWKFWASEQIALEITMREIYKNEFCPFGEKLLCKCSINRALAQILKREWFR